MQSYLIGYDLIKPTKDYSELYDALNSYGAHWHCLDSTWIIKSDETAVQVRDHLNNHIDSNDRLLVVTLSGIGAWTGFNAECSTWLKNNL